MFALDAQKAWPGEGAASPAAFAAEANSAGSQAMPNIRLLRASPLRTSAFSIAWSNDSKRVVACSFSCNDITVWTRQGEIVGGVKRPGAFFIGDGLGFLNNDRWIVAPPKDINATETLFSVFDADSGEVIQEVTGPTRGAKFGNKAYIIATSPDQSLVAAVAGSFVGTEIQPVRLYSASTFALTSVLAESAQAPWIGIRFLTFSQDSKLLAVARTDGSVVIFDLGSGKIVGNVEAFRKDHKVLTSIAISPDNQFIAIGGSSGPPVWQNPDGSPAPANQGKLADPEPICIYRISDGTLVSAKVGRLGLILSIAWGAKYGLVAFVANATALHLWNPWHLADSDTVVQLGRDAGSLAVSPDGTRLAAGGGGNLLLFELQYSDDLGGENEHR